MGVARDSAEPLQKLPQGMPRRYAAYKAVIPGSAGPLPTNVGGYDELLDYFQERGQALPRQADSLTALDQAFAEGLPAELVRPIGMFYGDLLTHTVPGAHWEVVEERYPLVRVTRNVAIDVVHIALGRLATPNPTLEENYAHVLDLVRRDA